MVALRLSGCCNSRRKLIRLSTVRFLGQRSHKCDFRFESVKTLSSGLAFWKEHYLSFEFASICFWMPNCEGQQLGTLKFKFKAGSMVRIVGTSNSSAQWQISLNLNTWCDKTQCKILRRDSKKGRQFAHGPSIHSHLDLSATVWAILLQEISSTGDSISFLEKKKNHKRGLMTQNGPVSDCKSMTNWKPDCIWLQRCELFAFFAVIIYLFYATFRRAKMNKERGKKVVLFLKRIC